MISVVIEAGRDERGLADTLSALVPAAAEGFVREVLVADIGSTAETRFIAEALGCDIIKGGRAEALAAVRGEWVLVLTPGMRLEADWFREAAAFIERAGHGQAFREAAAFRHAVDSFGWRARTSEIFAAMFRRSRASRGVLAHREALATGARLRVSSLRARAFVAE